MIVKLNCNPVTEHDLDLSTVLEKIRVSVRNSSIWRASDHPKTCDVQDGGWKSAVSVSLLRPRDAGEFCTTTQEMTSDKMCCRESSNHPSFCSSPWVTVSLNLTSDGDLESDVVSSAGCTSQLLSPITNETYTTQVTIPLLST